MPPPPIPPIPPPPPPPSAPVPPGVAQVSLDFSNSYILSDDFSCNGVVLMSQITQVGYKCAAYSANIGLVFQNVGNAAGSANVAISANDGGVIITPSTTQSVSVPANGVVTKNFQANIGGDGGIGTYEFTVNTGSATFKFKISYNGPPPSAGGA